MVHVKRVNSIVTYCGRDTSAVSMSAVPFLIYGTGQPEDLCTECDAVCRGEVNVDELIRTAGEARSEGAE